MLSVAKNALHCMAMGCVALCCFALHCSALQCVGLCLKGWLLDPKWLALPLLRRTTLRAAVLQNPLRRRPTLWTAVEATYTVAAVLRNLPFALRDSYKMCLREMCHVNTVKSVVFQYSASNAQLPNLTPCIFMFCSFLFFCDVLLPQTRIALHTYR